MVLCGIASTGHAEFNKKKPVLCSLGDLKECSATGCDPVAADEINAPDFLRIHVSKKTVESIAGGRTQSRKPESIEVTDSHVHIVGIAAGNGQYPEGFSYAVNVSLDSGRLAFAGVSEDVTFAGFGACMVDD